MKRKGLLVSVVLVVMLGMAACEAHLVAPSPVPRLVSVLPTPTPLPSATWTPMATPKPVPTQTLGPIPTEISTQGPFPTPTPGGPVWRILFRGSPCSEMLNPGCQSFDDTPYFLYIINSDGTDLKRVEGVPVGSYLVQPSPDGAHLAYIGPDNSLYLSEMDGTNPTKLLDNVVSFDFSHNGEYIYYSSQEIINDAPGHLQMQVNIGRIHIDGSGNSTLATLPTEGADIRVSLDGNWVLAGGFAAKDHVTRCLYVIRIASGETREIFSSKSLGAFHWSEGERIEFWVYRYGREDEVDTNTLYVVDAEGGDPYPTFTIRGIRSNLNTGDWSPDGREFAFMWGNGLALLDLDGEYWYPILADYSISVSSVTSCGPRCPW